VVRVVAVASVAVQHATYTVSGVMPWLAPPPFVWGVEAGANTLMVISGYFLCVTLAKRPALGWWWHRMARLLPAFAVAVVVTYLATLVAARHGYWRPTVRDLVGNLLLAQPWDPRVTWMDGSYWTLPLQVGAFTLAALAVLATSAWTGMWRRRAVLPVLAWLGVTVPVVLGLLSTGWLRHAYDGLVVFRWQLFAVGLAMWLAHRGRISTGHLALLTAAGVTAEYVLTPDLGSVLGLVVACVAVGVAAVGPDWSLLRVGPLPRLVSWLAGISYGVYLVNQQLGYFAAWLLQDALGITGWARIAVVLALAVGLGWLLAVAVERPAHRLLTSRGRGGPRDPQRGNDAAAERNRSFSSGVPALTRTPSPANARTTTLLSSACSENRVASSPSGSQTKLDCEGGTA
jgi:peptidoglycan/LPS O-acetylase OafA/YrhL